MKAIWEEDLVVKSYQITPAGRLKLVELFNYLQEAAGNHAQNLGWGYQNLREHGCFWVLSRIEVEIRQMPRWQDRLRLCTWAKGVERIFALRDYQIFDADGQAVVSAASAWLVLDAHTHRIQKAEKIVANVPMPAQKALDLQFDKIKPGSQIVQQYERTVSYNDLDINQHVNNARYIEWILDCYPAQFLDQHQPRTVLINYAAEARCPDRICITRSLNPENPDLHIIEGIEVSKQQRIFDAQLHWV